MKREVGVNRDLHGGVKGKQGRNDYHSALLYHI